MDPWQLLISVPLVAAFMWFELERDKRDKAERQERDRRDQEERESRDAMWRTTFQQLEESNNRRDETWRQWIGQSQDTMEKFLESLGLQLKSVDVRVQACHTDIKGVGIKFSQMEIQVNLQLDEMRRTLNTAFSACPAFGDPVLLTPPPENRRKVRRLEQQGQK